MGAGYASLILWFDFVGRFVALRFCRKMVKEQMVKQIPNKILVLGGAASGKSAFAEGLLDGVTPRVYIATYEVLVGAFDNEMTDKIAQHKTRRGTDWHTIESPRGLAKAIENALPNAPQGAILVDCMTMWLANIMEADMDGEITALLHVFEISEKRLILVSNETGLGIVPDSPVGRRFRQSQGELNQALAVRADCVIQVIAGLPLILKGQI